MTHALVTGGIKLLEFLFAGGLIGSLILVVLTSIEDFRELLPGGGEAEPEPQNGD